MLRSSALFLLLLAAPAGAVTTDPAAVRHHHRHRAHQHVRSVLPAPTNPVRPVPTPAAVGPAPVPDPDAANPRLAPAPAASATPEILQMHYPEVGNGYVYGSSPQAMDDKNSAEAPGLVVQVPIK